MYIAGFAITGVPWWAFTGFLAGLLNVIPHLGPLLALAIGLLARWFTTDDWVRLAYVGGVWLAIQIIDGFFLSARAAGRAGVNPIAAILLTIVAGFMFGPVGMLLAVRVVAVIAVVVRAVSHVDTQR